VADTAGFFCSKSLSEYDERVLADQHRVGRNKRSALRRMTTVETELVVRVGLRCAKSTNDFVLTFCFEP